MTYIFTTGAVASEGRANSVSKNKSFLVDQHRGGTNENNDVNTQGSRGASKMAWAIHAGQAVPIGAVRAAAALSQLLEVSPH